MGENILRYKKIIMLTIILTCLLAVSAVNAADNVTGDVVSVQNQDGNITSEIDNDLTSIIDDDVLNANPKTFTDLNNLINGNTKTHIYLNCNYTYNPDTDSDLGSIGINRAVTIHGNGYTIDGANATSIFMVYYGVSDSNVVFRNIVFMNGNSPYRGGGAVFGGSFVNCTFINNYASKNGGAIYSEGKSSNVVNCTFINNYAAGDGGAISSKDGSANVVNCTFISNSAEYWGGAMYEGSAVNCTFINNSADTGGAMYEGSAVNCTFINNYADWAGGAMRVSSSSPVVNCTFINNSAKNGGALFDYDSDNNYSSIAVNCSFTGNSAKDDGGALCRVSASNCVFQDNHADFNGGAMFGDMIAADYCVFINNSATNGGATYQVTNNYCTFNENTALENGGAVYGHASFNSNFTKNHANDGGAMYDGSAVNCSFVSNSAKNGGAMSKGRATGCIFYYNNATAYGGAVYNAKVSTSSKFKNNYAPHGKDTYNVTWFDTIKTFTDLNELINNNDDKNIYLNYDYAFDVTTDSSFKEGIVISRDMTIHGNGHTIDGAYSARILFASSGNVILRDIVFVNGNAQSDGGAVCVSNSSSIAVNCSFMGNTARKGGAIYGGSAVNCSFVNNYGFWWAGAIYGGSAVNCSFVSNSARLYGGAIYGGSVVNCSFVNNSAASGGAMYESGSAVNCSFVNNSANDGGALVGVSAVNCSFVGNSARNGGAMVDGSAFNCSFVGNSADRDGGAMDGASAFNCSFVGNSAGHYGGAMYDYDSSSDSNITAVNCTFINNTAALGGAMYSEAAYDDRDDANYCVFINNSATNGGATYQIRTYCCTFSDNVASENGGAMYGGISVNSNFTKNHANNGGGAVCEVLVANCLFEYNSAENGGAMSKGKATNCTFYYNNATAYGAAIYSAKVSINSKFKKNYIPNGKNTYNVTWFDNELIKSFWDLNELINDNNDEDVYLNDDYAFDLSTDYSFKYGIRISRVVTIHGNGFTIDGDNTAGIFNANNKVAFMDIVFVNGKNRYGGAINGGSALNCTFINNSATDGGAVYDFVSVINCIFISNSAYDGGAICSYEDFNVLNCSFVNNSAGSGGAITGYWQKSRSVVNCIFINNSASDSGGAMDYGGDAVNCTFINNSAEWGGAMFGDSASNCIFINNSAMNGGAVEGGDSAFNCTFINNSASNVCGAFEGDSAVYCTFINNSARYGGAMYYGDSAVNCIFINNSAEWGGAIDIINSILNCVFINNSASTAGAVYGGSAVNSSFINNSAESGGAMKYGHANNCTFINNSARNGGAIYDSSSRSSYIAVNSIFIDNSAIDSGGAIYHSRYDYSSIVNCSFVNNSAYSGGAMYGSSYKSNSVVNSSFTENSASYSGGAAVHGSFSNCIFTRNSAYRGGAISNFMNFIIECTFVENSANVGGAVDSVISGTIRNCNFTGNSALWEAGAVYGVNCVNCNFTENYADYGGAMKEGSAKNCIFTGNYAIFGGASYASTSIDCSFTENYADYGGAIYDGISTENCSFIENFADFGGAIYGIDDTANECRFINNTARNGGATYQVKAKDSYFKDNEATENGGAMYGESATNCIFKDNKAGGHGNDTYNTIIPDSLYDNNIIYFDASAQQDGDGSENNPYKYLYPSRITPGVTAYFAKGTYDLNTTCIIDGAKLIGKTSDAVINSRVSNQYDFIIKENSYLELNNLQLNNINILNHATLLAKDSYFEGNDVFDLKNLPKIESGSGLFDSSYGGVIVCDAPNNVRSTLILDGCWFDEVYDAFNGGVIAAINSDISISNTVFMYYSATYKGGAIYSVNSNLNIHDSQFTPFTISSVGDSNVGRYDDYTSYYGGSIYCENCDIYMHQSNFNGSVSFSFGGCIASLNSYISIEESNFDNSLSLTDGGGAVYNSKGKLSIFNSIFDGNDAEFGGAICNINSILDSYNSNYSDNFANYYGGVIYDIYGTLNFFKNRFNLSHALIGGAIYTRITNNISLYSNDFGDSFAQEGAVIFFDGKKESLGSYFNSFGNNYHLFAEFKATLDDENYYLISNPLYYQLSSEENPKLYLPYPIFEVDDGLVSIVIYDNDDASNISSIATGNVIRNVSAKVSFSEEFDNPVLNLYLLEDFNSGVFFDRKDDTNVYSGSRESLFDGYNIIKTYSIDLSDNNLIESYAVDFSIKSDNLYEDNSFSPVTLINDSSSNSSDVRTLPAYYDSNDYGFVSSVKDQKNGGNCWAFAGLATLETCIKKATGVTYDFSEENAKNLMAAYSVYGIKIETNFGGYDSMMMSYLTSWLGPIDESTESYDDYSTISVLENPMFHIQNIKFLPARSDSSDNDLYKIAIMDYGAVSVIFKWGKDYHAVSLVGWDDDYVGYDSIGNKANGAWIFKNSFGEDWENNGFGYLSYNQKISEQIDPGMHAYTFVFSDANPYAKVYQYDFAGVSQFYHYPGSIYFKNTFVAEDDSLLSAFSTYFDTQTDYTVSVYVNDEFVFAQNGTSAAGYYTIRFNNFIQLNKDDKFSIAVHNHNAKGYSCIPLCYAEEITKKTFNDNVSFVSLDGETWYDLHDYVDSCHVACIKAFTQNINPKRIRISTNDVKTINTKNFNIKVSFDDFEDISSINYCLLKFIVDDKTYYAQIKNGVACLNLNLDDGIHTLSAQYKDNLYESNIVKLNFIVDATKESYSFNAIQDIVNSAPDKSVISLNHDYVYDEYVDDGDYGVRIDKQLTINGNGHVLDGLNKATALYISSNNVVLNDIVFVNTSSVNGGGIYIAGRNVTLNNCIFINSSATQSGGAIYSLFDINLNNCKFINDSANMGGGLYLMSTETSHIENSCFENNSADVHGAAIYMVGAGNVLVSSTNFTDNAANYNGGAVFSSVSSNYFTDCNFVDNCANSGGAVFSNARVNEFINCNFVNNSANESGGALNVHNKVNVHDSHFINNSVTGKESPDGSGLGGGAIISYNELNIYNSDFIDNHAVTSGGALYITKYLNVYGSNFINNSASKSGGAVYTTPLQMIKEDSSETEMAVTKFAESNYYDSTFMGNHAETGGAIYNPNLVENCTFMDNVASKYGGAIENDGIMDVYDSSFINNSAIYGGAIDNEGNISVYSSYFAKNSADKGGAGIYSGGECNVAESDFVDNSAIYGGAIYLQTDGVIENSSFADNSADSGGAIYSKSECVIANTSFDNNSANYGGAINNFGNLSVYSCDFTNNSADRSGAGIYSGGECYVAESDFADNSANWGGAIYLQTEGVIEDSSFINNSASSDGGAIYSKSECIVENSSFTDNSANWGGAIDNEGDMRIYSCDFTGNCADKSGGGIYSSESCYVVDSDFVDNSALSGAAIISFGNLSVNSCDFTSNCADNYGGGIYSGGECYVVLSDFADNSANYGGAIYMQNDGLIENSSFISNSAGSYGGAICYGYADWCYFQDNVAGLDGDDVYNTEILTLLSVSDFTSYYNSGDKLMVNLTNSKGIPIANVNASISVYKNDDLVGTYYCLSGDGWVVDLEDGEYVAVVNVNPAYLIDPAYSNILIAKLKTDIAAEDVIVGYGSDATLVATLTSEASGQPIKSANVKFTVDGQKYSVKTDSDGQAMLTISGLASGTYPVVVSYGGNSKYSSSSKTLNIVVNKIATGISVDYDNPAKELTATLINSETGQAIKSANVRFEIDGQKYSVKTDSDGQAKLNISDLDFGTYEVVVSYGGNSKYVSSSITENIVVSKIATGISVYYDNPAKELTATLINSETGQAIRSANVRFEVDGQKYSVKTDSAGQAKLTISNLALGAYPVTVSYDGNSKYNSSSITANIVVSKITTSISLYYDNSTKELVATLINSETGQAIKGANVVFNYNGVKTSIKTDKQGQARLLIGDADPNIQSASISYGGNSKYLKSTASIKIIEGKIATRLSNTYDNETQEAVATLINHETGQLIKGATVVFNINGVKTALKTDKLGQVRLSVADLDLVVNSISSSYGGNFKYCGTTANINIVKI